MLFTVQCSNAASTDPDLVGTWETTTFIDGRLWKFTLEIGETEQYRVTTVTTDGKLRAQNGQWSLVASPHYSDGGTYTFSGSDSVSMTGKLGTAVWERVSTGDTSGGTRVDPALIGTWKLIAPIDGKQWTLLWTMKGAGGYEVVAVTEDGTYEARKGKWKSVSESGHKEEGTYTLKGENSVWMTGPKGSGLWTRVAGSKGLAKKKDPLARNEAVRHFNEGKALVNEKKWDKAIVEFNKAIELNAKLASAYFMRGNIYNEKEQHEKAIADFSRYIELKPKDAMAYYNRGNSYLALGQYDEADSDFTQTVTLNPQIAHAYDNRGLVYFEQGQLDKAIADFKQALKIDHRHANAMGHLERAQERKRGPVWVGDEKDDLLIRIQRRSKGAVLKRTMNLEDVKSHEIIRSVAVRSAITTEGAGYLSIRQENIDCHKPDSRGRCGAQMSQTSDTLVDLIKIDPATVKIKGPSWDSGALFMREQYEGWRVDFLCKDKALCYGKKGWGGYILCRNRTGCEAMADDLKALVKLVRNSKDGNSKENQKNAIKKKDRPSQDKEVSPCNASIRDKSPEGHSTKKLTAFLQNIPLGKADFPAGLRLQGTPVINAWEFPREDGLCARVVFKLEGTKVSGEVEYAVHNTFADAKQRSKRLQASGFDFQILDEDFHGVTVKIAKVTEGKETVGYCWSPKEPEQGKPLPIVCMTIKPSIGVLTIARSVFAPGSDWQTAVDQVNLIRRKASHALTKAIISSF